ncbi:MAG: hypothetical protein AAGA92_14120 [Planctomycetota bacterium]
MKPNYILSPHAFDAIVAKLEAGRQSKAAIAREAGVSVTLIGKIAAGDYFYQKPIEEQLRIADRGRHKGGPLTRDPTPEEIAAECAKLHALRERPDRPEPWGVPVYSSGRDGLECLGVVQ